MHKSLSCVNIFIQARLRFNFTYIKQRERAVKINDMSVNHNLPAFHFCGFRKFAENEHHITRISTEHILILMFSGTLNFSENGKEISLNKNEFYIQKAGFLQEGKRPSNRPEYFFVHFTCLMEEKLHGLPLFGNYDYNSVIDSITKLNNAFLSPTSSFFEKSFRFLKLLEVLDKSFKEPENSNIKRALNYIQENYSTDITLTSLSEKLNYSKDYMIKLFKKTYGITPHQYIIKLRIEEAKAMLSSSSQSIETISSNCGFNDVSSFHRAFFKETSLSPKQFRIANFKSIIELSDNSK